LSVLRALRSPLLPYTTLFRSLTIVSVKWAGYRHFDNARPRDPTFYADTIRARALGAHQNGIEAFPFLAVAVLLAEFRLAPQHLIDRKSTRLNSSHDQISYAVF